MGIEEIHQCALVKWASFYPSIIEYIHHSPNGGRRSKSEGRKFKLMGTMPGFWDLFIMIKTKNYSGLFIEMKSFNKITDKKGTLTKEQIKFRKKAIEQGFDTYICYDWEEGKEYILNYLKDIEI